VQIEYLNDPESTARPVLLIYGDYPKDAVALQRAIGPLATGDARDAQIDALPGFAGINDCSLTVHLASTNLGLTRVADTEPAFRCALDSTTWSQVAGAPRTVHREPAARRSRHAPIPQQRRPHRLDRRHVPTLVSPPSPGQPPQRAHLTPWGIAVITPGEFR